ncbi:MAG TPA: histidinol dehydrogenase [Acidimicrobiia bacterium]|jgi:histidinol dehydrogenase
MLARLDLRGFRGDLRSALGPRPSATVDPSVRDSVAEIIADVRARGDAAVRDFTERYDGLHVDDLRVHKDEIQSALDTIDPDLRIALEFARDQIASYHEGQCEAESRHERAGVRIRELVLPVDRAGCYVPGGRAAYPSTVLMTALPARIAGVPSVVLCVPPDESGNPPASTLAAAALSGVDAVYRVGGAQAIAALAFGTETIEAVDVVVGPGNAYVAEAKRQLVGVVGIDSIAGPSELVVVADDATDPRFAAADLLAQAEHGPGGRAVLVTWSERTADEVESALEKMLSGTARRDDAQATLATGGRTILVDDAYGALDVSNELAPEHLELMTDDAVSLVPLVRNAGAVFVGECAPAVIGDYVAGVNHVLPTGTTARFASALRVADFQKRVHVVSLDDAGLQHVAPYATAIADAEGLLAHGDALRIREVP